MNGVEPMKTLLIAVLIAGLLSACSPAGPATPVRYADPPGPSTFGGHLGHTCTTAWEMMTEGMDEASAAVAPASLVAFLKNNRPWPSGSVGEISLDCIENGWQGWR